MEKNSKVSDWAKGDGQAKMLEFQRIVFCTTQTLKGYKLVNTYCIWESEYSTMIYTKNRSQK